MQLIYGYVCGDGPSLCVHCYLGAFVIRLDLSHECTIVRHECAIGRWDWSSHLYLCYQYGWYERRGEGGYEGV